MEYVSDVVMDSRVQYINGHLPLHVRSRGGPLVVLTSTAGERGDRHAHYEVQLWAAPRLLVPAVPGLSPLIL